MHERLASSTGRLRYEPHLTGSSPWKSLLDEPLRSQALKAAFFVAERMRDLDFVEATAKQVAQQASYPIIWSASSLAYGCGSALMYGYFDSCFPEQGWDVPTQSYLSLVASVTQQMGFLSPSLFGGASGIALALVTASRRGRRYQKTLARLHQGINDQVLEHNWYRSEVDWGVADSDYDIISGASGILAYLVSTKQSDALVQSAIEHLLKYLTWLAKPGQVVGKERWYVPASLFVTDAQRLAFPQGNFNCGLAHGMPGPLAALALTSLAGYRYPGYRESIAYLSDWIIAHSVIETWGIDWPNMVPFESASNADAWKSLPPTRSAWCYGAPGVSRALWLAGQALEDDNLLHVAVEAIESVLRKPVSQRHIPSPHICHGTAGLLQICLRFAHESESALVKEHIPILVEQILDVFDPAFSLGFRDIDQGVPIDQPAWLTGAPGIAMALLAASTPVEPSWDRVLAIA